MIPSVQLFKIEEIIVYLPNYTKMKEKNIH
jgi:hypothetical protein